MYNTNQIIVLRHWVIACPMMRYVFSIMGSREETLAACWSSPGQNYN